MNELENDPKEKIVYLQCNKIGSKLRINIISPGYSNVANCQFPKNIRTEGKKYKVPAKAITVAGCFYRVKKSLITIIDELQQIPDKIFRISECCVCLSDEPDIVLLNCGHLCCCEECTDNLNDKCPLCMSPITGKMHKNKLK